jgi:hypothetical protein
VEFGKSICSRIWNESTLKKSPLYANGPDRNTRIQNFPKKPDAFWQTESGDIMPEVS